MAKTIKLVGAGVPEEKVVEMIANAILENDKKKHPVGSILFTDQNVNPATYMGFGTWELWGSGMVPIGVDTNNTSINASGKTIGTATVSIAHTHSTPAISATVTAASGNTGSTTPGATGGPSTTDTGSTTPGATGAWSGTSGSTTPGATGAATGNTGSTTLTVDQMPTHNHNNIYWAGSIDRGLTLGTGGGTVPTMLITAYEESLNWGTNIRMPDRGGSQGHTHTLNSHTHSSAAHTHSVPSHTHTSAAHTHSLNAHTHTSAAHTHSLNSHTHDVSVAAGTTGAASTTSVSVYQPSIACYMWKRVA